MVWQPKNVCKEPNTSCTAFWPTFLDLHRKSPLLLICMWLKCLSSDPNYLSSQHSNLPVHTLWAKADAYLLSCHAQWFFLENSLRVPSWRLLLNNHEILLKTNSIKLERIQAIKIIPVESLHIRALRLIFNGDKLHIF